MRRGLSFSEKDRILKRRLKRLTELVELDAPNSLILNEAVEIICLVRDRVSAEGVRDLNSFMRAVRGPLKKPSRRRE